MQITLICNGLAYQSLNRVRLFKAYFKNLRGIFLHPRADILEISGEYDTGHVSHGIRNAAHRSHHDFHYSQEGTSPNTVRVSQTLVRETLGLSDL